MGLTGNFLGLCLENRQPYSLFHDGETEAQGG